MSRVDREQAYMFLREAWEATTVIKRLLDKHGLDDFIADIEARYAMRYSIVLLVEAIADLATIILEADYGIAPESYRDAVLLLAEKNIIPYSLARELVRLVSLRNMLVHRYWRVDDARLYSEARTGLDTVHEILERLEHYVSSSDP